MDTVLGSRGFYSYCNDLPYLPTASQNPPKSDSIFIAFYARCFIPVGIVHCSDRRIRGCRVLHVLYRMPPDCNYCQLSQLGFCRRTACAKNEPNNTNRICYNLRRYARFRHSNRDRSNRGITMRCTRSPACVRIFLLARLPSGLGDRGRYPA